MAQGRCYLAAVPASLDGCIENVLPTYHRDLKALQGEQVFSAVVRIIKLRLQARHRCQCLLSHCQMLTALRRDLARLSARPHHRGHRVSYRKQKLADN